MNDYAVGQEIREEKIFTAYDVEQFAQISGDKNPIHLDRKYAKKSRFGDVIVHGILVSGLISKMIGMDLPGEGSIYLEQNLQFRKPVYVGEKVLAIVKIIDVNKEKHIYDLETNIYNEKNDCAVRGTAKVLYEG